MAVLSATEALTGALRTGAETSAGVGVSVDAGLGNAALTSGRAASGTGSALALTLEIRADCACWTVLRADAVPNLEVSVLGSFADSGILATAA